MLVRPVLGLGLLLTGGACIDRAPFPCEADPQCEGPSQPGRCVDPGFCAHPDDTCPSGLRFGRFASDELALRCTTPDDESSGSGSSSSSGSSSGSSSSGEPIPVEECDGVDNDGDGLIDEWSAVNEQCSGCDLYQREGSAYWRCSNDRWGDVQNVCAGFGADLASIQDAEENLFLALLTPSSANWIGLNDIGNEGVFTWVDGAPVDYTNWSDGTPPGENIDSNCGGIDPLGDWRVFPCNNSRPGFCEAPHLE